MIRQDILKYELKNVGLTTAGCNIMPIIFPPNWPERWIKRTYIAISYTVEKLHLRLNLL